LYDYTSRLSFFDNSHHLQQKGQRATELAHCSSALAATVCAFNQCEDNQAFLLSQSSSKALECVTKFEIVGELFKLTARQVVDYAGDDFDGLISALCETRQWGAVYLAMQMCNHELQVANSRSRSSSRCRRGSVVSQECAMQSLVLATATLAEISTEKNARIDIANIDRLAPYAHSCDPLDKTACPFRLLVEALHTLDNNDLNWALHLVAADKITSCCPASGLPKSLLSSFMQRPGSINALLSLLTRKGQLNAATEIAICIMTNAEKDSNQVNVIPYDTIDKLFHAARLTVSNYAPSTSEDADALASLKSNVQQLQSATVSYFLK
jgi:hypothetical protein